MPGYLGKFPNAWVSGKFLRFPTSCWNLIWWWCICNILEISQMPRYLANFPNPWVFWKILYFDIFDNCCHSLHFYKDVKLTKYKNILFSLRQLIKILTNLSLFLIIRFCVWWKTTHRYLISSINTVNYPINWFYSLGIDWLFSSYGWAWQIFSFHDV